MNPKNRFRYSYVIADIWDTEWMLQELRSPLFSDHHELMDVLTDPSQTSAFLVSRPLTTEFLQDRTGGAAPAFHWHHQFAAARQQSCAAG